MARSRNVTVTITKVHLTILAILLLIILGVFCADKMGFFDKKPPKQRAVEQVAKNTDFGGNPTRVELLNSEHITKNSLLKDGQAKEGDILLIYEPRRKAVIWRPADSKIISVLDTTRGDGLDVSDSAAITIFYINTETAKQKAKNIQKQLSDTWPELAKKIKLEPTDVQLSVKSFIAPGATASDSTMNDITTLTEKISIPISTSSPKKLLHTKTSIIVYIKE